MSILGVKTVSCFLAVALLFAHADSSAQQTRVRLSGLSDVNFGSILTTNDSSIAQSVCAYSSSLASAYSVRAIGSQSGSSFALTSINGELPIEIQWAGLPNQSFGEILIPNVSSSTFVSSAIHQKCNRGPSSSATIVFRVLQGDAQAAEAGVYSGTVTFIIAPM